MDGQNNTSLSGGPWKEKLGMPQSWQILHGLLGLLLISWLWFSLWFTPSVSLSLLSASYFLVSQSLSGDQAPKKGAIEPVLSIHPLSLPVMPCPVLWEWGRIVQPASSGQCVWITYKSCRTMLQRAQVSRNFSSHIPLTPHGIWLRALAPTSCPSSLKVVQTLLCFFFQTLWRSARRKERATSLIQSLDEMWQWAEFWGGQGTYHSCVCVTVSPLVSGVTKYCHISSPGYAATWNCMLLCPWPLPRFWVF